LPAGRGKPPRQPRSVVLSARFLDEIGGWIATDPKVARKLLRIMTETMRDPFHGVGKPEPLKGELKGLWSRRLTDEDRIVYEVTDTAVNFVQCKYHYVRH
jgi:toxin YoeB